MHASRWRTSADWSSVRGFERQEAHVVRVRAAAARAGATQLHVVRRQRARLERLAVLTALLARGLGMPIELLLRERVLLELVLLGDRRALLDVVHLEAADDMRRVADRRRVREDDDVREDVVRPHVRVTRLGVEKGVLKPFERRVHLGLRRLGRLGARDVEEDDGMLTEEVRRLVLLPDGLEYISPRGRVDRERAVVLLEVRDHHFALAAFTRLLPDPVDRAAVGWLVEQGEDRLLEGTPLGGLRAHAQAALVQASSRSQERGREGDSARERGSRLGAAAARTSGSSSLCACTRSPSGNLLFASSNSAFHLMATRCSASVPCAELGTPDCARLGTSAVEAWDCPAASAAVAAAAADPRDVSSSA